jgi:lia operon protein LiaG
MRMASPPRTAFALLAALALATPAAAQAERFTLTGGRAVVHNLAGEVSVAAGTGSAVVVEVTRGGQDAARLRVTRDGDAVRVAFPGDRVVYPRMGARSRSTISVRPDGTLGGGGRTRRVTVAGSGSGTRAYADVRVLVPAGRAVEVHQGVGRVQVSNVNGRVAVRTHGAAVRAQGTRGELGVEVGSGAVEVRDAQGSVTISAGSGAVTLAGVRGAEVEVETGSGAVTGSDVRAEALAVDVGSGAVRLSGVSARTVEVETGSGAIDLGLVSDAQAVTIETGSGGVDLRVPAAFGADVLVETGSGGITVDVPVTRREARRGSFRGRIGDGNGRVEIETGSGGVRIRRQ